MKHGVGYSPALIHRKQPASSVFHRLDFKTVKMKRDVGYSPVPIHRKQPASSVFHRLDFKTIKTASSAFQGRNYGKCG